MEWKDINGFEGKYQNAYHLTNYATLILREAPTVDAAWMEVMMNE